MSQIDQRQMLPMGTVLDHRYRIVCYLASGGFGNTYVAEDTRLGGQVAVKEFFMRGINYRSADGTTVEVSNDTNTPVFNTQLKKFQREARRIFELHNEHIIHVSDLFDANGTSYYVMDLVNGTSLAEQTRQQPISEHEVRNIAMQVLDALEAMHNAGLYHLDVKPGNIMRDDRGHCTLIDFGASKQLTADERNTLSSSTMAYTPGYAPVEQVAQQSKIIGPWTDFYALGATLYRLVTGTTPPEVSVADSAPDGRRFPYPKTVSTTVRYAISTLMNPIYTLRPQTANEVRVLLDGTKRPVEKSRFKKKTKSEEAVLDKPSPDPTNEKTQRGSSPTPIPHSQSTPISPKSSKFYTQNKKQNPQYSNKEIWYGLTGLVAVIFFIVLKTTGGCEGNRNKDLNESACPDDNHPHAIDLGLPSGTKWACCNVDANSPEDYGGLYAWGETSTKSEYSKKNYKYSDATGTQFCPIGTNICGTQYDVAHEKWGGSWQMPTLEQIKELLDQCNKGKWATQNGVKGRKFIGPNGSSIFLPFAGYRWEDGLDDIGLFGYYWSSTQNSLYSDDAFSLYLDFGSACNNFYYRSHGQSVRPVYK